MIHVIGAGWAGLAAAVYAQQRGEAVTVYEASRQAGGRARSVGELDNGQHLLMGAYTHTLALMRTVGVNAHKALFSTPLDLRNHEDVGLRMPSGWMKHLPALLQSVWAVSRNTGWSYSDKLALLRHPFLRTHIHPDPVHDMSVADLCAQVPAAAMHEFITPLCVSALNVWPHEASARVFLNVLRSALGGPGSYAQALIPRVNLGEVLPHAAVHWLHARGVGLAWGHRIENLNDLLQNPQDRVVLACTAPEAARLSAGLDDASAQHWSVLAAGLQHRAIATVYLHAHGHRLRRPMQALPLPASPHTTPHAQFVFDHHHTHASNPDRWAAVVSACNSDRDVLEKAVLGQLQSTLQASRLEVIHTIIEKRATFACTPGLLRPPSVVNHRVMAVGDYIDGPFSATLEGAVRSALAVHHWFKR